jgi:two-component system, OmpR family, phosphate regulon response regulator PhoB
MRKILLVEDELPIREMVQMALESHGFSVTGTADARSAELILADGLPDLILLDWMLPGIPGVEFARMLRKDDYTREIPIIMLTARGEEEDRVRGFDAGADDYVVKPFSPRELVARINAVLRRTQPDMEEGVISFIDLRLDTITHRVTIEGDAVDLGPTEFRLLQFFLSHLDRVYSRSQLLDHVWSRSVYVEERTIDVHIRRLRKALEGKGYDKYVQTVRGAGYRFSQQQ